MPNITPIYSIAYPDPNDTVVSMPETLRQQAETIEDVLQTFNYNGADPNLVLAKVAQLEIDNQNLKNKLDSATNKIQFLTIPNEINTPSYTEYQFSGLFSENKPFESEIVEPHPQSGFIILEDGIYNIQSYYTTSVPYQARTFAGNRYSHQDPEKHELLEVLYDRTSLCDGQTGVDTFHSTNIPLFLPFGTRVMPYYHKDSSITIMVKPKISIIKLGNKLVF